MYVCVHVFMYLCMYACMYVCYWACTYLRIYVFVYVCVYVCMYVWWTPHMQLPHSHRLFLKQISVHIEKAFYRATKTLTNHKLVYLHQSEIGLFWPIRELSAPLAIQSRIRQLVEEANISRHSLLQYSFAFALRISESTRSNCHQTRNNCRRPRSNCRLTTEN